MRKGAHELDRRTTARVRARGRVVFHGEPCAQGPIVDVSATADDEDAPRRDAD